MDGDDTERNERVELVVIGGDEFPSECLSQRDTEAICQRYSSTRFQATDTLPESAAEVVALDDTGCIQISNSLPSLTLIRHSQRVVEHLA